MTKKITIGDLADGRPVSLDLGILAEQRLLVQGTSGSGKSGLLRRLLEQTHGLIPQVVIDVEGEFATLRREFPDYVLAAAEGGDVLAAPYTAKKLATWVNAHRANAILDVSEMDTRERIEFVRIYLDTLVNLPRKLWKPVLLVLDEAQEFAPEGSASASLLAVERAALRGRKRGIILVAATPRISDLSKSVTSMLTNKLIGKTQQDIDVRRAANELGISSRDATNILRDLKSRNFVGYGGAFRIRNEPLAGNLEIVYIADTKTHPPKSGELVKPRTPTPKMKAALATLNELPKEAQQEVRDLADAKKKIAELERELKAKPKPEVEVKRIVVEPPPCGHDKEIAGLIKRCEVSEIRAASLQTEADSLASIIETGNANIRETVGSLLNVAAGYRRRVRQIPALPPAPTPTATVSVPRNAARLLSPKASDPSPPPPFAPVVRDTSAPSNVADGLTKQEQRLLDALATLKAFGLDPAPQFTLCAVAGMSLNGPTYAKMKMLAEYGYLVKSGTDIKITAAGDAAANHDNALTSREELHDAWCRRLKPKEQEVLRYMIGLYPDTISKPDLAAALGWSLNGPVYAKIARVRDIGAINENGKLLMASPLLFPEALA